MYHPQTKKGILFNRLRNERAAANKKAKKNENGQATTEIVALVENMELIETNNPTENSGEFDELNPASEESKLKSYFKHCLSNDVDLKKRLSDTVRIRRDWIKNGANIYNSFGFFYTDIALVKSFVKKIFKSF